MPYKQVQKLLGDAARDATPFHDDQGRFWELAYAEFMALGPIYGITLIAEPGPERGDITGLRRSTAPETPPPLHCV